MKTIFIFSLLILSFSTIAAKPELVLRYSYVDSWRLPQGELCFYNTPVIHRESIFLRCSDTEKESIYKITDDEVKSIYTSKVGQKLTDPVLGVDGIIWAEYSEGGTRAINRYSKDQITKINFKPDGLVDGLAEIEEGKYVFRWRNFDGDQFISTWKTLAETWSDHPERSFAFTPAGYKNQLAYKLRLNNLAENSADMIYWWKNLNEAPLKVLDRDADAESNWQSFRNTVALSGTSMIFVGRQVNGTDAIGMVNFAGQVEVLVEAGKNDVKSIDFFAPSINKTQNVLFRGLDFEGRRALFLWQRGKVTKILTQGDVVHTDKGVARIDYKDSDSVFMSAPTISGNKILIQTALIDFDDSKTLIGVGLIQITL